MPPFPLGISCLVTCKPNLGSLPFLSPALPWVGTKDLEMYLTSHCLLGCSVSPPPTPEEMWQQRAYLPLGNPFQTDQLSSRCPNHHKTFFPSKGCLRTFAHSVIAAQCYLHLALSMAPIHFPKGSAFEHRHLFACWPPPPAKQEPSREMSAILVHNYGLSTWHTG